MREMELWALEGGCHVSHSDWSTGAGITGLHVHIAHLNVVVSEGGGTDTGRASAITT